MPIRIKPYAIRLYLAVVVVFLINKFALRPFVLAHDFPVWAQVFVLSVPNTCEAVIGTLNLAGILLAAKRYLPPRLASVSDAALGVLATGLAAGYVLPQELKLHNLGGRNVYDPFDLIASIVGLVVIGLVVVRWGVLEEVPEGQGGAAAR